MQDEKRKRWVMEPDEKKAGEKRLVRHTKSRTQGTRGRTSGAMCVSSKERRHQPKDDPRDGAR